MYQHPTWQLYLDGVQVLNNTSENGEALPDSDQMPLFFGMDKQGIHEPFNGGFHAIRASHQARYTENFSQHLQELIFRPQLDDAALWYFAPAPSEGDFTVPDLSGNGNNLDVRNGNWFEDCYQPVSDLRCLIEQESTDVDGDPLSYESSWMLDDTPIESPLIPVPDGGRNLPRAFG